eukprot:4505593-Pleurochrysis_carterae.AAC.1
MRTMSWKSRRGGGGCGTGAIVQAAARTPACRLKRPRGGCKWQCREQPSAEQPRADCRNTQASQGRCKWQAQALEPLINSCFC